MGGEEREDPAPGDLGEVTDDPSCSLLEGPARAWAGLVGGDAEQGLGPILERGGEEGLGHGNDPRHLTLGIGHVHVGEHRDPTIAGPPADVVTLAAGGRPLAPGPRGPRARAAPS